MTNLVFRHLAGSRANQVDEFDLESTVTISFGRDPSADVSYDPERDDLVSRRHAEIKRDAEDETRFTLTDLDSSNGTFLNGSRISGTVDITVGDQIRFGEGGPEFTFDLDPRPEWAMKATRIGAPIPQTRVGEAAPTGAATAGSTATDAPPSSVGRATVERMIDQQSQGQKRSMVGVVAGVLAVLAVAGAFLIYRSGQDQEQVTQALADQTKKIEAAAERPMTPRQVADTYAESVVFIEFAWKLVDTNTGKQVFHRYVDGVPAYLSLGEIIEPWLILDDEDGTNKPIGVNHATGTGFVVTDNGFVLTNRHVAANWKTRYNLPLPGKLYSVTGKDVKEIGTIGAEASNQINFVPSRAKLLGGASISGKNIEGRLDYFDVTFRKNKLRIPARLVRVSDTADVALIKVDLPTSVAKVELFDNYDEIRAGDPVVVLGYPGMSPGVMVATESQDPFNRERTVTVVPEPTVSSGNIGKVLRGTNDAATDQNLKYLSTYGDAYQLTVNSTGAGNSGGPVFDAEGRVVGIYTSGSQMISFAIPIRYGLELMDIRKVID